MNRGMLFVTLFFFAFSLIVSNQVRAEDGEGDEVTYFPLKPALVVNLQDEGRPVFMQIIVEVMAPNQETVNSVKEHMPHIRNNLILLFSGQTRDTVMSSKGQEKLREQALSEVQKVLQQETGEPGVEQVLFTRLVVQ